MRGTSAPVWLVVGFALAVSVPPTVTVTNAATSSGPRAIYEGVAPARILDTRAVGQGPALAGGVPRDLQITGAGGVPADAIAVVVSATIRKPTVTGYLTVWPTGATRPDVSNVNFASGTTITNLVTAAIGDGGAVSLYVPTGPVDVLVDVVGYYRGHDHDDRYLLKAQAQARTAANALTCSAGSVLQAVAADGTPVCVGNDVAHDHDDLYYRKTQTQTRTAANAFTCAAGQVLQSVGADGAPVCVANTIEKPSPLLGVPTANLTVSAGATFTLNNDVFYETALLGTNSVIKTNGYRLFVRGTLSMASGSKIERNGNAGTLTAAGAALANGAIGGSGAGACGTPSPISNSLGGVGQNGGATGAAATRPVPAVGGLQVMRLPTQALIGRTLDTAYILGGSGGGGGACNGVAPGGGGGGGGVVIVAAGTIVVTSGTATISADGGPSAGAGGGGGGLVIVASQNPLPAALVVRAAGGTGGTSPWGPGGSGVVFHIPL